MSGGINVSAAVGGFFRWWVGELAACIPVRLRRFVAGDHSPIVLTIDGEWVQAERIARGERKSRGRYLLTGNAPADLAAVAKLVGGLRGSPLFLALPRGRVLRKSLDLPLAAETDLDALLHFELDRQTPFTPEQARYAYRVTHRDRTAGRMSVELAVAPREAVERLLALAGSWGVDPVAVTAEGDELSARPLDLSGREATSGIGLRTILAAMLVLAAAFLLMLAVAQPLQWQAEAAREAEQALDEARAAAREALVMREALEQLHKDTRYLMDRKLAAPFSVAVLADVTRLLPDDSYLFELQLRDGRLRLRGYAPSAAPLLELFENHPNFAQARFESPITKVPGIDKERFDISVELVGEVRS